MTGVRCEVLDPTFCSFPVCELKAIKRNTAEVTIHTTLLQKPVDNVTVYGTIKKRGYDHLKAVYEYTIDACAFMRNKRRNPIAAIFYKIFGFEKYSNMNHTCPYNHDLLFEKFRFDPQNIDLLPLPAGHFTVLLKWSTYNVPRVNIFLMCQILEATK